MAISATMTIWGLYRYDPTIFDTMTLPTGIEKEDIVEEILLDGGSLEILYPQPDFLKSAIAVWSKHRAPIWAKMLETTEYEYNPIYNYDRYEEVTEGETGENSHTAEQTSSGTSGTTNESSADNTATVSQTGYNSNTFVDTNQQVSNGSNSVESNTESSTTNNIEESGSTEIARTRSAHLYGNIGVTTTMQMIEAQRGIIDYDVTQVIVDEFLNKFCLAVY